MNLPGWCCSRTFLPLVAAWLLIPVGSADAQSRPVLAPNMPLPPCEVVDGVQRGACPAESEHLSGSAAGRFSAGGTVLVWTDPTDEACDMWWANTGEMSPAPCYVRVAAPQVVGCATIDLSDGERFRELPCAQALYLDTQGLPNPLFTTRRPSGYEDWGGATTCGAIPSYSTYAYGGPFSIEESLWRNRGPLALPCELTLNGTSRPDGLYGPTWVKVRVSVNRAEGPGDMPSGTPVMAELYVPIDGDLRFDSVDVSVLATSSLEGSGEDLVATYTATLTNLGQADAENVEVIFVLPPQLHFQEVSDDRCTGGGQFVGGTVRCNGLLLAGAGDPAGRDVEFIDLVARIVNASDLEDPVVIRAIVADDIDPSNNEDSTRVQLNLRSGSIADTRQAMEALRPYFDYETRPELLNQQCNVYMDDVFERLQRIRLEAPEVFENLSFGRITSGDYYWAPVENRLTRAGHVGVVVYLTGTNYRQTGIVIHGTPTWSPTDLDLESQLGIMPMGDHVNPLPVAAGYIQQGTQGHGMYYRTPIGNFPGSPTPEAPAGCGFEGVYSSNQDEFDAARRPANCVVETQTCPFYPDAVVVRTESPVDALVTNPQGQRVETRAGEIFVQELDTGIHSFRTPHEDGTFGWMLVLPPDDYDIELLGTGEGPYRLTLTTFDGDGEAVETVFEGDTQSGQVNEYRLEGAVSSNSGGGGGTGGNTGGNTATPAEGGGGSAGIVSLLALMIMLSLSRVTARRHRSLVTGG